MILAEPPARLPVLFSYTNRFWTPLILSWLTSKIPPKTPQDSYWTDADTCSSCGFSCQTETNHPVETSNNLAVDSDSGSPEQTSERRSNPNVPTVGHVCLGHGERTTGVDLDLPAGNQTVLHSQVFKLWLWFKRVCATAVDLAANEPQARYHFLDPPSRFAGHPSLGNESPNSLDSIPAVSLEDKSCHNIKGK